MRAIRRLGRKWSWVSLATLLAALAGASSELLGQDFRGSTTYRGLGLEVAWMKTTATTSSLAIAWSQEAAKPPDLPKPVPFAAATGYVIDWNAPSVKTFWTDGQIDRRELNVTRGLQNGQLDTQLPGTRATWTPSTGWAQAPGKAHVRVSLINQASAVNLATAIRHEMSRNIFQQPILGKASEFVYDSGTAWDTSGRMDITFDGDVFVPENAATTWGELRSVRTGAGFAVRSLPF